MQTTVSNQGKPAMNSPKSGGVFAVFQNRSYALYFSGQFVSLVGTWMQQVALSWYTYTLTNSPLLLAVVGASSQLPSLLIMPFAGVFADRLNRKKVIVTTQLLAMVEASILAYLTLTHQVQVWHLIGLGLFAGVINAFDMPTRSAFVYDLVEKKSDLPSAIAMNSTLMNITRLIGPALAGFVVAMFGTGTCFLLNAISYIVPVCALALIKGNFKNQHKVTKGSIGAELKEGLMYVMRTPGVRALILMLGVFGIGGMAYAMLLPVYVKSIGGDSNTLGYLMTASAIGSLCGTFMLASRKSVLGLGKWIVLSSFAFSIFMMLFAMTHSFWPAMIVLAFVGACMMIQMASINTILQTIVEEDKRGRVMSLFTMAFMGAAPIGSLAAGALADRIGLSQTLMGCGIYCFIVSVVFALHVPRLREATRPIYIEKGLLMAEEEAKAVGA
jgi:MFS family permease